MCSCFELIFVEDVVCERRNLSCRNTELFMVQFANLSTHGTFFIVFGRFLEEFVVLLVVDSFVIFCVCVVVFVLFSHCLVARSLSVIAHLCYSHWFFSYLRWPNCKYHADGPDVLVDAAASAFGAQTHVVPAPSMMDGLKADP